MSSCYTIMDGIKQSPVANSTLKNQMANERSESVRQKCEPEKNFSSQ